MNKSPDERFLIESKKQNTNLEKYGVEYPSTLPNNRKKSKIKMVKFWESLNDDERTDLILSFQHAWTEERRNDKSLDMKVLWASLTDEEKQFRLSRLHAGIKSTSSLETRIQKIFNTWKSYSSFEYIPHFYIKSTNYDFLINESFILEVNGDYWHANPKIYKSDDVFQFSWGRMTSSDIWNKDETKRKLAVDNNYKIGYIWESDMNKLSDIDLESLLIDIINENFTW